MTLIIVVVVVVVVVVVKLCHRKTISALSTILAHVVKSDSEVIYSTY